MTRHPRTLSGPRALVGGARLGLPLRGLSCPGNEIRDVEPPFHGATRSPEPNRRVAPDGGGDAIDARPGSAAQPRDMLTTGDQKQPQGERPRARERILVAMLGLALAAVLAHAARRSTTMRNPNSRRFR